MDTSKRILITGASGFIGGFIVEEALKRNYEVWAGIRASSSRKHLKDNRIHFIDLKYDNARQLQNQLEEIASTTGRWHFIVHNAGITKTLDYNDFYRVNAYHTQHFVEALSKATCTPDKFLLISSLSNFGPIHEHTLQPIRLNDAQYPNSHYGKSKLEAERIVMGQKDFPFVIIRPTGVYGPKDKDYLIEIKSIKSGFDFKVGMKPQHLTFIYVRDLVSALFLALENESVKNAAYFVADGDIYTDEEFSALVQKLLGKKHVIHVRIPLWMAYLACRIFGFIGKVRGKPMTLNPDKYHTLKQRNWICDIEPTRQELGFKPLYNLEKGLLETIDYNKKEGLL